mgnify:CR=1 FL=1
MVVQLVGRDPATMAQGARLAAKAGAEIIDIKAQARKATHGVAGRMIREPGVDEDARGLFCGDVLEGEQ